MAHGRTILVRATFLALAGSLGVAEMASADTVTCQKALVTQLQKFKKAVLLRNLKCNDLQNVDKIGGPCPDLTAAAKIQIMGDNVREKVGLACTVADVAALGFTDCQLTTPESAAETTCDALGVTDGTTLADCLMCWKQAEMYEFLAIVYASHAEDMCGGDLDFESTVCSPLDTTGTTMPEQHDLGDTGENDCQRKVSKAGIKHLLKREKLLEKCGLQGGTAASCAADAQLQLKLGTLAQKTDTLIMNKCGSRDPLPNPPFCCKTAGNNCDPLQLTRDDCELAGYDVQEDKICGVGNMCDPAPGNKKITWWDTCPEGGATLVDLDDLKACVQTAANDIADETICFQLRGNGGTDWPCPASPSGAFLEMATASILD
jgi:hypothetical protein